MRLIRVPVAILLTLSMPSLALAQVPPPPSGPATQPQPEPETQPTQPTQPTELTEDQKAELAKVKYMEAEELFKQSRWAEAVPLYEEAYYLVPGKHGFAHKVGVSAFNAGDCNKANTYLKHFIQYGDPEKNGDKFEEAKQILGEISVSGCASATPTTTTTTTTTADPVDNENPLGDSSTEIRQQETATARNAAKSEKRGLLIGGAVLTSFGVVGLAIGFAGLGMASGSAGALRDLSSNQTNTGFPVGDYECRNVEAGECPSKLENKLATGNGLAYGGMIGGGILAGVGVALLAVYMVNKKKNASSLANKGKPQLTGVAPALLPGGMGAFAEVRF
jgi:hypothetical protein